MESRKRCGNKSSLKLLSFVGHKRKVERKQFYGYNEENNAFWLRLYFVIM